MRHFTCSGVKRQCNFSLIFASGSLNPPYHAASREHVNGMHWRIERTYAQTAGMRQELEIRDILTITLHFRVYKVLADRNKHSFLLDLTEPVDELLYYLQQISDPFEALFRPRSKMFACKSYVPHISTAYLLAKQQSRPVLPRNQRHPKNRTSDKAAVIYRSVEKKPLDLCVAVD